MTSLISPIDERELVEAVAGASSAQTPLEVCGGGSKAAIGRPIQTEAQLTTQALAGITLYEPSELVLAAGSGTPLNEVEAALAQNRQQLAFEPVDLSAALGEAPDRATIGSVFAMNFSGARRILSGAARDHFLGVRAVNGRGELFKSGGRVLKNVTGYDLCRGLAGSWGTLAVMSEVTVKVLPVAEESGTLIYDGLSDEVAVEALCAAMGTPYEVSGAIHLDGQLADALGLGWLGNGGEAVTALRLETRRSSLDYRGERLAEALAAFGRPRALDDGRSRQLWSAWRELKFLQNLGGAVWRISTMPRTGPGLVSAIARNVECRAAYDWAGGLIWLLIPSARDAAFSDVRRVVAEAGGHATLIRADPAIRAKVDVFQTLDSGNARLTAGIKQAYDPGGILNPGRMYAGV